MKVTCFNERFFNIYKKRWYLLETRRLNIQEKERLMNGELLSISWQLRDSFFS